MKSVTSDLGCAICHVVCLASVFCQNEANDTSSRSLTEILWLLQIICSNFSIVIGWGFCQTLTPILSFCGLHLFFWPYVTPTFLPPSHPLNQNFTELYEVVEAFSRKALLLKYTTLLGGFSS